MPYDIIIRFPNKKLADHWTAQMSDGFGEEFCDLSPFEQIKGTDGSKPEHYVKNLVTDANGNTTNVYFINHVEGC